MLAPAQSPRIVQYARHSEIELTTDFGCDIIAPQHTPVAGAQTPCRGSPKFSLTPDFESSDRRDRRVPDKWYPLSHEVHDVVEGLHARLDSGVPFGQEHDTKPTRNPSESTVVTTRRLRAGLAEVTQCGEPAGITAETPAATAKAFCSPVLTSM